MKKIDILLSFEKCRYEPPLSLLTKDEKECDKNDNRKWQQIDEDVDAIFVKVVTRLIVGCVHLKTDVNSSSSESIYAQRKIAFVFDRKSSADIQVCVLISQLKIS
jgi:hypothetical protein